MTSVKLFDILIRVAPIFAMLALGYLFRKRRFIGSEAVANIRLFISKVTLPAVVFGAFSNVLFNADTPVVFLVVFAACGLGLLAGLGLDAMRHKNTSRPFLLSSFEAGMLGFPLFAIVFGMEGLPRAALTDLGEIAFTFIVLLPLLNARAGGERGIKVQLGRLVRNPVIWAVCIGSISGVTGLSRLLSTTQGGLALSNTVSFIGAPTGALILFCVGYELDFSLAALGDAATTIAIRYAIWIPLFFGSWALVSRFAPAADTVLRSAFLVLFILPPTFAIPIFCSEGSESRKIATTISLNTLVSVIVLSVIVLMLPA